MTPDSVKRINKSGGKRQTQPRQNPIVGKFSTSKTQFS